MKLRGQPWCECLELGHGNRLGRGVLTEQEMERGGLAVDVPGDSASVEHGAQRVPELGREPRGMVLGLARGNEAQGDDSCSRGNRMGVVGAGMSDPVWVTLAQGEGAEELDASAHGSTRHSAGEDLAECREVGTHAGDLLHTSWRPPEPRNNLIENEHGARLERQTAHLGKKTHRQRHRSPGRARRLENERGDIALRERLPDGMGICRDDGDVCLEARGKAGCVGTCERRICSVGNLIVPAMKVAGKLDDPRAARRRGRGATPEATPPCRSR